MYQLIYNYLLIIVFILCSPWILYQIIIKRLYRHGMKERFGFIDLKAQKGRQRLWIHAASVGEVLAAKPIIDELLSQMPSAAIFLSTITDTGYLVAHEKISGLAGIFHAPVDFPFVHQRIIRKIKPSAVLILETELWPNLIDTVSSIRIPIMIVNGRISDKSYPRYRLSRFFLKGLLRKINVFSMQSTTDADRIVTLGASPESVFISGNVKYDQYASEPAVPQDWHSFLSWASRDPVLVAGSTHPGEEQILLQVFLALKSSFPRLKVIIAPRHLQRLNDVETVLAELKIPYIRRSQIRSERVNSLPDVIILDTMGELNQFYRLASVTFVGGSLVNRGGHNVLEPAGLQKPILFGPFTNNFKDAVSQLIHESAAIQVKSEQELAMALKQLLSNPQHCREMGERGYQVVQRNRGAVQRNLKLIMGLIHETRNEPPEAIQSPIDIQPYTSCSRSWRTSSPGTAHGTQSQAIQASDNSPVYHLLQILSSLYAWGVNIRNARFDEGRKKTLQVPIPVISVGNLSVGGTGKTPLTAFLASAIREAGISPCILSRGYGGRFGSTPRRVPLEGSPHDWGDEPLFLARNLPEIPVIVARNRYQGAVWAMDHFSPDICILDDGFQHRQLHRTINILLLDARYPLKDQRMMPLGRLREPIKGIGRADMIIFSHCPQQVPDPGDLELIKQFAPTIPIFYGTHDVMCFRKAGEKAICDTDLQGKHVGILTAIANPAQFRSSLEHLGMTIVCDKIYPDHFPLTIAEWHDAVACTIANNGLFLITTAKDEVKFRNEWNLKIPILVMDITFSVHPLEPFLSFILNRVSKME